MAISTNILALIEDAADRFGLPIEHLQAQVQQESSGNPLAIGPFKEIGLLQISLPLAQDLGLTIEELKNPTTNLNAGAGYLRRLLDKFRTLAPELPNEEIYRISLWGYNGGPGYVQKAISMIREKGLSMTLANLKAIIPTAVVRGRNIRTDAIFTYADRILKNATMLASQKKTLPVTLASLPTSTKPKKKPSRPSGGSLGPLLWIGIAFFFVK